jgi:hypothetical protein
MQVVGAIWKKEEGRQMIQDLIGKSSIKEQSDCTVSQQAKRARQARRNEIQK